MYVSAALKEEFGIAIIEAMAVASSSWPPPVAGRPPTSRTGVTGVLVDTTRRDALAAGVTAALDLAVDPAIARRADSARAVLRERFGIGAMAAALDGRLLAGHHRGG